ncbi:hypothetical protein IFM89_001785 [Coptis chinensis]|uniref:MORF/ORRM1/DAG-like MORF domain-containing protein n=1 Tax=Coptis chinensis TaxID=261450 RepID=A0A835HK67_9MAGN|nr:hypothetical protein IFM89_001785 [Coptis chinensis]
MPGVLAVLPDCLINNSRQVQSIARFSPTNRNYHLNDVFSYYHLSERNLETISDNWCVVIRKPDGKFGTEEQTFDFCIQMLTKVLGSEEDAKKRIYIVWGNAPFGFCAEISVEMLNKLNGLPNVIALLPDFLVISLCPLRPDRGHFYETWDEHYADPENSGEHTPHFAYRNGVIPFTITTYTEEADPYDDVVCQQGAHTIPS